MPTFTTGGSKDAAIATPTRELTPPCVHMRTCMGVAQLHGTTARMRAVVMAGWTERMAGWTRKIGWMDRGIDCLERIAPSVLTSSKDPAAKHSWPSTNHGNLCDTQSQMPRGMPSHANCPRSSA